MLVLWYYRLVEGKGKETPHFAAQTGWNWPKTSIRLCSGQVLIMPEHLNSGALEMPPSSGAETQAAPLPTGNRHDDHPTQRMGGSCPPLKPSTSAW